MVGGVGITEDGGVLITGEVVSASLKAGASALSEWCSAGTPSARLIHMAGGGLGADSDTRPPAEPLLSRVVLSPDRSARRSLV